MSATSTGSDGTKKALAARVASLERKLSVPRFCDPFLKGTCQKGDACPLPHLTAAAVEEIKRSNRQKKQEGHKSAPAPRQRSQSKGNNHTIKRTKSKKSKGNRKDGS